MKVYHQLGFRYNWNIDSLNNGVGDGVIFSPVNIEAEKIQRETLSLRQSSFLDPQVYLLSDAKPTLTSYPYYPGNIKIDFNTDDLTGYNKRLAELCINFQLECDFQYVVIPNRYYEEIPSKFYELSLENFVYPFLEYKNLKGIDKPFLLSIIVKQVMIEDENKRNELLNWLTGLPEIVGVYVIFENRFTSKQIKDFEYLKNVLAFIQVLKNNEMEVHIGYSNTESFVYSAAMPDSITIGSYENLRSFKISRFENSENGGMRGPNARLYSSRLLQWVDYNYIQAMKSLVANYLDFFDDSEYKPLMFDLGVDREKDYKWHFTKPEPYKHYFKIYTEQVKALPNDQQSRIDSLLSQIDSALSNFSVIKRTVRLDENSDDSHLAIWLNALQAFRIGI